MNANAAYGLAELNKEKSFGGIGATKARAVPLIDMSNFVARKHEIADQLWKAVDRHRLLPDRQSRNSAGADRRSLRHDASASSPCRTSTKAQDAARARAPMRAGNTRARCGLRPARADQKESYQITLPRMAGLWPAGDELPGFKAAMLAFERANWALGMKVLSCFALKLGFAPDFFTDAHDPLSPEYQSTLRLLHYLPMINAKPEDFTGWRAGAHTDFDCLTLLHQRTGQGGLQLCPGKESGELAWTDVEPPARRHHLQHRRHADALERRPAALDAASRAHAARRTNISGRATRCRSSARPTRTR